jgi:hypothetical protein
MAFKSILKPEGSVMAGAATVGLVIAIYQMNLGTGAQVHATDANHPVLEASRKKSGYTALAAVSALTLITKDANIGILGGATIIALELNSRHAIMANPITGRMEAPEGNQYAPSYDNVVPMPEPATEDYNSGYAR